MQKPRIEKIAAKKLVGHSTLMSLVDNKTFELFSGFMPKRKQINNTISEDVYEVIIYDELYFKRFNQTNTFTKWATLEVSNFRDLPESMDHLTIDEGSYAVFKFKGLAKGIGSLMTYIFSVWLPKSEYQLDNRPHFNVLGEKYKNNHPDSEEDIWIPIKLKG